MERRRLAGPVDMDDDAVQSMTNRILDLLLHRVRQRRHPGQDAVRGGNTMAHTIPTMGMTTLRTLMVRFIPET